MVGNGVLFHEEGEYLLAAMHKLSHDGSKLLRHLINQLSISKRAKWTTRQFKDTTSNKLELFNNK